jgi:hypothetical protein
VPNIKNPAIRERNTQLFFGCSESAAIALNGHIPLRTPQSPADRYLSQRTKSFRRGVGWEITFPEWLSIWMESGNWTNRGIGIGKYCMARHGDVGPYRVGNVSIQLVEVNSRDGIKIAHATLRRNGGHTAQLGTGRGWTKHPRNKKNPYQVTAGRKYVGSFPTQEAAEAAYKAACLIYRECVSHSSI